MDTPRETDFFKVYYWTVEMFSLALVVCYWVLLFSGFIWGTKLRYHYLLEGSLRLACNLSRQFVAGGSIVGTQC